MMLKCIYYFPLDCSCEDLEEPGGGTEWVLLTHLFDVALSAAFLQPYSLFEKMSLQNNCRRPEETGGILVVANTF